jgi:RNA polymerase sigma-B factor
MVQQDPARTLTRTPFEDLDAVALEYAASRPAPVSAPSALRNDMVTRCLPFARRMARRYAGHGEPIADLEQVAALGLVKAIDRYDPERGSFTAYAVTTMTGELKRHFRDRTWSMHVTRRMKDLSREVSRTRAAMTGEMARTPTPAEIADRIGADVGDVHEAIGSACGHTPMSLSSPVGSGDGVTELGELIGRADRDLESADDRITVARLLKHLPEREQEMLALRFYGNRTQADIAAELGISQMHVSRLLGRALAWLREALLGDAPPIWPATAGTPTGPYLTVRTAVTGPTLTLMLLGEIDRDTSGILQTHLGHAIRHGGRPHIVVDLSEVPIIDAAGIGALADGATAAAAGNVRLEIIGARPHVAPLLAVCGLGPGTR